MLRRRGDGSLDPSLLGAEQSNTSVQYGDQLVLKLFRKLESGVNPDLEIGRFLTDRGEFAHTPKVAGGLELRDNGDVSTLAILQEYVPNEGDAWTYTLDTLRRYFEDVLARRGEEPPLLAEEPHRADRRRVPAARLRHDRLVPRQRPAARRADRRDAPRAGGGAREPGLRAGAVLGAHPARPVPVAAHAGPAGDADRAPRRPRLARARGHRRPRERDPRDVPPGARPEARRDPHPLPRRLPPRPGPVDRQGLGHHRLRGRADPADLGAPAQEVAAARRRRDDPLVPLRRPHGARGRDRRPPRAGRRSPRGGPSSGTCGSRRRSWTPT